MERGWLQAGVESSDQLGRVYSHCRPVGGLGASFPSIYDPDGGQLPSQPLLCVLGRLAGCTGQAHLLEAMASVKPYRLWRL